MKNITDKNAFTLAEIMIVLTVIGIVTAVLLPSAFHSTPDENIMKFKKANNIFQQVVKEMVTSDLYYKNGDLGLKVDGTPAGKTYFCNTFANIVSTKSKACDYDESPADYDGFISDRSKVNGQWTRKTIDTLANGFDNKCRMLQKAYSSGSVLGVLTTDGISYYEASLLNTFGCIYKGTENACEYVAASNEWDHSIGRRMYGYDSYADYVDTSSAIPRALRFYRIYCIDIDGIISAKGLANCDDDKDICPFGYAVRTDGKIMPGKKAKEWLKKSIQDKD